MNRKQNVDSSRAYQDKGDNAMFQASPQPNTLQTVNYNSDVRPTNEAGVD